MALWHARSHVSREVDNATVQRPSAATAQAENGPATPPAGATPATTEAPKMSNADFAKLLLRKWVGRCEKGNALLHAGREDAWCPAGPWPCRARCRARPRASSGLGRTGKGCPGKEVVSAPSYWGQKDENHHSTGWVQGVVFWDTCVSWKSWETEVKLEHTVLRPTCLSIFGQLWSLFIRHFCTPCTAHVPVTLLIFKRQNGRC